MIVVLLEVPRPDDPKHWALWGWHHRRSHEQIIAAIAARGRRLTEYLVDPIDLNDFPGFLQRNSQMHIDMDAALGVQGSDMEDVDINNPQQLEAWIYLHYQEHFTAEAALGIHS